MDITWLGHSCFVIKGKQATVVTDPYHKFGGYKMGLVSADIITISHQHDHHNNAAGVHGTHKDVTGPGEYEIKGIFVTGIGTYHDNVNGEKLGKNTIYLIEIDGIRVCHLGDLGHKLTSRQTEELSEVDVLMVPVGGLTTVNAPAAAEVINMLDPEIVIPMHYKTDAVEDELEPLEKFLKEMGHKEAVAQPKLNITKSTLKRDTQLVVLDYKA
ncbi:MAG: MBL fold metallo-hydrolase [Chloroflexi bacterium]|jgi:L-ascorbate metabolism protein UlaG (beta-lactamase superfamily)|nr:MBL fold metallo-hydrolase [Chloroflexota bacterium]MBT7080693.1 MBL fold metallo-hydrolase [Chloroflexota bacterium]MBT7290182.1 MBL fold metallo-hydrolase [Chloroflexota bacterium]